MEIEQEIIEMCLRYKDNLAAILIFGSYNTGQFVQGISDIDIIILLKNNKTDFEKEKIKIKNELSDLNLTIHHFTTIENYERHIYEEGSWSSWITVICGSKAVYSTPEFEKFKTRLEKNTLEKEKLIHYLKEKDKSELQEKLYKKANSEERNGWELTKWLFSHIRRKLQVLNFYSNNEPDFNYFSCLDNLENLKDYGLLMKLGKLYENRGELNKNEIGKYVSIAKKLTKLILTL